MIPASQNDIPYGRERTYNEANLRWHQAIKKLKFKYRLTNLTRHSSFTHRCQIIDHQKNSLLEGFGKGKKIQSIIGAKYESLEHIATIPAYLNDENVYIFSVNDALKNNLPFLESRIPAQLFLDKSLHDRTLAWVKFKSICSKNYYFSPAISCNPHYAMFKSSKDPFDYKEIYINHSNSGCAIGGTYDEALLHSILEIIERDAASFFLINTFLAPKKKFLKIVELEGLELNLIDNLQISVFLSKTSCELKVFEMPNEFEIPAYCAVLYHPKLLIPIKGFGCSPILHHALERAIFEAIQIFNIYETKIIYEDELTLKALQDWPQLMSCIYFDFDKISHKQYKAESYFAQQDNTNKNLKSLLQEVIAILNNKDFDIIVDIRYDDENFCALQSLIPACEEFYLIIGGTITTLGHRAKKMLYTDII